LRIVQNGNKDGRITGLSNFVNSSPPSMRALRLSWRSVKISHSFTTPGALAAIGVSGDDLSTYLARHQSGDWGDIDAHDPSENQLSLELGFRLMSVYTLSITGVKIWMITEADRSSTCILLPEEY
jgi:hypothetical protein